MYYMCCGYRSYSTGSLISVADSVSISSSGVGGGGGGLFNGDSDDPKLEEYIEMFITILIVLDIRRRKKPTSRMYV